MRNLKNTNDNTTERVMTMSGFGYIALGLLGIGAVSLACWLSSRRRELPCPTWLSWMVEMDNPFTRSNQARHIVEHLKVSPGMKVLDAGCGPGRLTIPLAEAVGTDGEVTALDIQEKMLEKVREKAQALGKKNVKTLHTRLGEGQLPENSFDRAALVTVLGEIPDQLGALREILEALKPGGYLIVAEVIFDPHFQRYENVLRTAQSVGFGKVSSFGRKLAYNLLLEKPIPISDQS